MLQSTLGTALKGSEGGTGSWGKGGKKSELCVAGENLLELERTKGGEGGGNGMEVAHPATETLKIANNFFLKRALEQPRSLQIKFPRVCLKKPSVEQKLV